MDTYLGRRDATIRTLYHQWSGMLENPKADADDDVKGMRWKMNNLSALNRGPRLSQLLKSMFDNPDQHFEKVKHQILSLATAWDEIMVLRQRYNEDPEFGIDDFDKEKCLAIMFILSDQMKTIGYPFDINNNLSHHPVGHFSVAKERKPAKENTVEDLEAKLRIAAEKLESVFNTRDKDGWQEWENSIIPKQVLKTKEQEKPPKTKESRLERKDAAVEPLESAAARTLKHQKKLQANDSAPGRKRKASGLSGSRSNVLVVTSETDEDPDIDDALDLDIDDVLEAERRRMGESSTDESLSGRLAAVNLLAKAPRRKRKSSIGSDEPGPAVKWRRAGLK